MVYPDVQSHSVGTAACMFSLITPMVWKLEFLFVKLIPKLTPLSWCYVGGTLPRFLFFFKP